MEERLLNKYLNDEKKTKPKWISKILWCLIFFFASLIFTSLSDKNLVFYKKYVFDDSFNFMSFKSAYEKIAGSFTSEEEKKEESQMVFAGNLEYTSKETFFEGEKYLGLASNAVNALSSGIVVFAGEKENFQNTVIIQGSNGYDFWYGNLDSIDINIYDYVKESDLIGSINDSLYLVITKNNQFYTYDEYLSQI